ncbi:hypothetical protein NMY22_g12532 [Coprinellus aureogranulatus]|nr:hypothetical protein NMY22_g12532 [Coprinellus aureogranulatus]
MAAGMSKQNHDLASKHPYVEEIDCTPRGARLRMGLPTIHGRSEVLRLYSILCSPVDDGKLDDQSDASVHRRRSYPMTRQLTGHTQKEPESFSIQCHRHPPGPYDSSQAYLLMTRVKIIADDQTNRIPRLISPSPRTWPDRRQNFFCNPLIILPAARQCRPGYTSAMNPYLLDPLPPASVLWV